MPLKTYTRAEIEKKIHQVIDATPIHFAFIDQDERYVFVNKMYEKLFGKKKEEIEGKFIYELIPPDVYQKSKPLYQRALSGESVGHELTLNHFQNGVMRVEINFVPIWEDNKVIGMVVTSHDVTERWEQMKDQDLLGQLSDVYAQNLDEHETIKQVLTLLKNRLDCTAIWLAEVFADETAHVVYEDQKGSSLFGRPISLKIFGKDLSRAYVNGEIVCVEDAYTHPLTAGNNESFDMIKVRSFVTIPLKRKGQLKAFISIAKENPYQWKRTELTLIQSVSEALWSDIENTRLLQELKASLQARDEFISICSHELKTPISSLKLIYEMAKRELENSDPRLYSEPVMKKRIQISNNQILRMTRLIEEMLEVTRIAAGKLQITFTKVDLREAVTQVLDSFHEQLEDLNITVNLIAHTPVYIAGDAFRIEQVVTNFLTNAMKYGNSLPITIEVTGNEERSILKVKDQGIGMSQESFDKIFHRFERATNARDISGLGLGLYITSQIVEAHHGTIQVNSEPEKGSEFMVEFPAFKE